MNSGTDGGRLTTHVLDAATGQPVPEPVNLFFNGARSSMESRAAAAKTTHSAEA